jgi:CubicO group peptidase (beta-lactamase class C family)
VVDVHSDGLLDQALLHTWSAVKPVTGTCLLHLGVDVEMPVVEVWPEVDDDRLLVRHLLTHTAGRISRCRRTWP